MARCGALRVIRNGFDGNSGEDRRLRPALTLDVAVVWIASSRGDLRERFLEDLRLAGLGENGLVEAGRVAAPE